MQTLKGDLITLAKDGKFDVIVHGCNCFGTMGSGIAKQIKAEFPEAYQADQETISGLAKKLGTISVASVTNNDGNILTVVNAYTQYGYMQSINVDYNAVRSCFREIKKHYSGLKIGFPLIGCGLAGGDWDKVSLIIEDELQGEDFTVVIWEKQTD